ncbi:uncharacterized protein LOC144091623 [Stigmatopora argus]
MGMFSVASLLVVFFWQTVVADVWCRWNSSCVLEAIFPAGEHVVVQWHHMSAGKAHVHTFYDNADQLADQTQRFRGRTSLLKEKLKEGKASLLLRNVVVGDNGTYECYVATVSKTTESTLEVHVEAPVTAIQIRQVKDNQLLCSSEGIYPRPQIRWFFGPALAPAPDSTTNVSQQAETKLFSIKSSLRLMGNGEYVCEVSASNSSRRTTWRKTALNISDTSKRIECAPVINESGLAWTFYTSEVIASRDAGKKYVADAWAKYVEDLSEDGGLHLRDLTPDRSGEYTCARSNATQTRVNLVFLRVTEHGYPKARDFLLGVLGVLVCVAVVVIINRAKKNLVVAAAVHRRHVERERVRKKRRLFLWRTHLELSCPESTKKFGTGDDADNRTGRYQASNNGQSLPVGKKSSFASRTWWESACQSITECRPHSLFLNTRKL